MFGIGRAGELRPIVDNSITVDIINQKTATGRHPPCQLAKTIAIVIEENSVSNCDCFYANWAFSGINFLRVIILDEVTWYLSDSPPLCTIKKQRGGHSVLLGDW